MLRTPKTAHEVCWSFAIACRNDDVVKKRLTRKEHIKITIAANKQRYPSNYLTEKAFVRPFQTLTKMGLEWTYENMLTYWLQYHSGPLESTPVYKAKVIHAIMYGSPNIAQVQNEKGNSMFVDNIHGFDLHRVKYVYIHGLIIAYCA